MLFQLGVLYFGMGRTALEFQGRLREVIAGFNDHALTDLHCGVGINTGGSTRSSGRPISPG